MGNKVTCTCGHSWNKSDSSKKDATVCHICGKDNEMKNGGWLDKYEQGGMVLKQKTNDNYGKKDNPNDVKVSVGDDYVGLAYDTTGRNYSPAWGGQFAMGGTIPGSVGFTYARTGDTPSEGPYAKKTLPSAQNGQEMQYYQEGLDWKPKNISRNGGWLDAYDVPKAQFGTGKTGPLGNEGGIPLNLNLNLFKGNPEAKAERKLNRAEKQAVKYEKNLINQINAQESKEFESGEWLRNKLNFYLNNYPDSYNTPYRNPHHSFDPQPTQQGVDYGPSNYAEYGNEIPKAQNGKTKPPIFTDNKNDPRIKNYNDSLSLYNKGELNYQNRLKFNKENNIPIKSTRTWDDPVEFDKFLNYSKIQPIQGNGYWYNHSPDVVTDTNISGKLTDNNGFRYKKPVQPVVYKKPDPTLKPRNRVDQEFIEITPGTPQLAQGPDVQVQQRPIQNLPYQVDWRMGNEDRTNYFVNEEEGAKFLKELNPVTGLPEYRNRGDYNASGRYSIVDKLRGFQEGGMILPKAQTGTPNCPVGYIKDANGNCVSLTSRNQQQAVSDETRVARRDYEGERALRLRQFIANQPQFKQGKAETQYEAEVRKLKNKGAVAKNPNAVVNTQGDIVPKYADTDEYGRVIDRQANIQRRMQNTAAAVASPFVGAAAVMGAGAAGAATIPYIAPALNAPLLGTFGSQYGTAAITGQNLLGLGFGLKGASNLGGDLDSGYYSSDVPLSEKVDRGLITAMDMAFSPGVTKALGMGYGATKNALIKSSQEVPKPTSISSSVDDVGNISKNLQDLNYTKNWAKEYGYQLPENLERVAKSDELTNRTIKGIMNRHNTFVRGVSTNWEVLSQKNPEILRHLEGKGFNLSTEEGSKKAAEYMATHIPIQTGYGRASIDKSFLNSGNDGLYTSNSIPTAEGYTYGDGFIVKAKKPTDFSSLNRKDWIDKNQLKYIDEDEYRAANFFERSDTKGMIDDVFRKDNTKYANKTHEEKIAAVKKRLSIALKNSPNDIPTLNDLKKIDDYSSSIGQSKYEHNLLRTEKSTQEADPFKFLLDRGSKLKNDTDIAGMKSFLKEQPYRKKLQEIEDLGESLRKYTWEEQKPIRDRMAVLKKEADIEYNQAVKEYMKKYPDFDPSPSKYAHYIHTGNQGEKVLEPILTKRITPEIWKNKSRSHTNIYSKKLSALEEGGIIQDDKGQWAHPGEITQINSPYITMEGVPYPVLGIADTGEEQMMYPGQDYEFEGAEYVTEYPKGKRPKKAKNGVNQADENSLVQLDQLTNFTNYNKPTKGGWLDKY